MRDKRGFTLVELLATLAVLAIILLIGTTSVTNIIKKNRQKLYDSQISSFIESAKIWAMDNTVNLPQEGEYSLVTYGQLVNQSYIKRNIENPLNGEKYNNDMAFCIKNTNGNYTYELSNNGACGDNLVTNNRCFKVLTFAIMGYYDYIDNNSNNSVCPKNVVIPSSINNITITKIGLLSFKSKNITSVVIPNTITVIDGGAFDGNQLTSVIIPDSVKVIQSYAFQNNKLTSIVIPESVTNLEFGAFINNQLTDVTLPSNLTKIAGALFSKNQLTSITIPPSVTTIEGSAFKDNLLSNVVIPNTVTSLGDSAFYNNKLTSVTISNSITRIGDYTFNYNKLTNVTIPNSITTIGKYGFGYNALTSVVIPSTVTTIDDSAFNYNKLTSVAIPNSVTTIGNYAFYSNQLAEIIIPNSVTTIGNYAFAYNIFPEFNIPASVTSVGSNTFSNNPYLLTINVDNFEGVITDAPWGASTATINYLRNITYIVDNDNWAKQKKLTIKFPNLENQYQYQYSLDNGKTFLNANNTQELNFSSNAIVLSVVKVDSQVIYQKEYNVSKIDNTAPSCGAISGASTTWTNANRAISVGCSDNGECTLPSFTTTYTTTTKTSNILISDKAGNTTSCPVNVYVDKTKPVMTGVNLVKSNGTGYASGSVSTLPVTAYQSATDNLGISKYIYSHSPSSGYVDMPTNWLINWDGSWNFYVKAVDSVGNISDNYISYTLTIKQPVSITNMITNGGFESNNFNGWNQKSTQGGNVFVTTDRAEGTYAGFFAPVDNTYWAQRYQNIWSTAGHIYYARAYAKTSLGKAGMIIYGFSDTNFEFVNTTANWAVSTGTFRASKSQTGEISIGAFIQHIGHPNYVDGLMLIDLTAAYGAGREPTSAWCDANIPNFTGTISANRP